MEPLLMDHESIEGLVPAYALGAADFDESRTVEAHLAACATCRDLLAEYRELGSDLLYAAPPMAAPAGLTERMRERLAPPRHEAVRGAWWTRLHGAFFVPALAAAVLLLVITNVYWFGRVNHLDRKVTEQASLVASLANAPATALRAEASAPYAQGVVYTATGGQAALLCVYGMPALPSDKAYQLWLIKDGKRESGGVFQVSEGGFGFLMVRPTRPLTDYSSVGITIEPSGGSPAPTSPRVIGGNL
jgi:anti-sigma-K factor RskA